MRNAAVKTRFAPSPTGFLHLGNARTALFSALLARRQDGVFLLRIEDTDRDRSRPEFVHALQEDLWWLDLKWNEGPPAEGETGPYHQSEREAVYAAYYQRLEEAGLAYPCFCSATELEMARGVQRASGQAPRYSGKCARLTPAEAQARRDQGVVPTLRFRVPDDREMVFHDLVRGEQRFRGSDIGDFIIRRADGSPAFFFCNAVDDALMGVTHVLRGEDHLANTPRQLLLLEALGLPAPRYGHIALIVGPNGSPLSKRHGSRSVRELREEGYFALAVVNYLARLGHNYESEEFLPLERLAAGFELERLGKAPARFDGRQLLHWQHRAVEQASWAELWEWMGEPVHHLVPEERAEEFVAAIRPNVAFPEQALQWAQITYTDPLNLCDEAREIVAQAGYEFFQHAVAALDAHGLDFHAFSNEVKRRTGAKGKGLFLPLRAALTGETGGPEMVRLLPLLGFARARQRLSACAA